MLRPFRAPGSRFGAPVAALALGASLLAGCSTGSTATDDGTEPESTTSVDADAFPVTLEHAFGETTIEEEPTRVATLGWNDHDTALSLGVVPVGATKLTWGGNEGGSSDWFDAALEEMGAEAPVRYDDADGAPVVEIAKLDPDLILATNSGLTEEEYKKLSKIAPVVAYPEAPWITPWQTSLEMVGEALGRSQLAEDVRHDTEHAIEDARAEYPQLEGASLIFAYLTTADLSMIGLYAPEDPRVSFMHDLGLVDASMVADAIEDGQFYGTVSAERAADLGSDVLITYAETEDEMATFEKDPLIGQIPAIESGHAFGLVDKHVGLAVTNPTPLSIPYTIEHFVPDVAKAVDGS